MFSTFRSDLQRAILSRGFLAGVLGLVVVIVLSSVESLFTAFSNGLPLPDGYHAQFVMNALPTNAVVFAVPIICALPFTPVFVDDMQSGFIKQFLPRTSVGTYIRSKLLACAVSGGLVLSIGILFTYALAALVFLPLEGAFNGIGPLFLSLLAQAGMFFISGMFWSLVGFTLASMTKSRYMAYAAPFIFYYILIIIYERYFNTFYYFYPREWLNPSHFWLPDNWGLFLLLLLLTLGISGVFAIFARGKLHNG